MSNEQSVQEGVAKTEGQQAQPAASAATSAPSSGRGIKAALVAVYAAIILIGLGWLAKDHIPQLGGPQVGVVDIQGLIEEYQTEALEAAREGSEEEQEQALEETGFMVDRIEKAVDVLAERHEGVVLVQAQAVASDAGLKDYTPELREIIDPTAAVGEQ